MELDILEKNNYISAGEASRKVGYAPDYIGQLCRAKRVNGELRDRTWYVELKSLITHKQERKLGRRSWNSMPSIAPGEPVGSRPGLTINSKTISYLPDQGPLIPEINKSMIEEAAPLEMSLLSRGAVLLFSTLVTLTLGGLFHYGEHIGSGYDAFALSGFSFLEGSVDNFLVKETGVGVSDYLALLKASFLEASKGGFSSFLSWF